jgi:glycosyltransferase involved in cell wall biosynthesis
MTALKTILAFPPGNWTYPEIFGSTRYHLWTLASMGWRVVYIEPPMKPRLTSRTWKAPDRDFHVLSPSWVPPFAVRYSRGVKLANKWRSLTSLLQAKQALRYVHKIGWKPDVYWFGAPWHGKVCDALPPGPLKVGHFYDELSKSPALTGDRQEILWSWEKELLTRLDIAFCTSLPIIKRREQFPGKTLLVENVISEKVFFPEEKPVLDNKTNELVEKMRSLPRPLAAYGGIVDLRLNLEFFQKVLEDIPNLQLAMLGAVSPLIDSKLKEFLEHHPRVHLFGRIPYSAYLTLYKQADVLLLGHHRNAFTDAMYPEKLTEYFAVGKPVVSVDLPEVVRVCKEEAPGLARIVSNSAQFSQAVGDALKESDEGKRAARIAFATHHTFQSAGRGLDQELQRGLESLPFIDP